MDNQLSILIVDDDPDWLEIISRVIKKENDMKVAATAVNKNEAVKAAGNLKDMDVVLMDISLSENNFDGLDAAEDILKIRDTRIFMLTALKDKDVIIKAIKIGAVDYIVKDELYRMPDAIRSAVNNTSVSKTTFDEINKLQYELNKYKKLTHSEKELYDYKEEGYSIAKISKIMFKSTQTLKNQLNTMYRKFNVTNFKDLIKKIKQ